MHARSEIRELNSSPIPILVTLLALGSRYV
jgi:hypothetical protein